jgi:glycine hydroxymethyltransferase
VTSGLRFGSPACTPRGFDKKEFEMIGEMIVSVLNGFVKNQEEGNYKLEHEIKKSVADLCKKFPIY